jgi:hypothetical protein
VPKTPLDLRLPVIVRKDFKFMGCLQNNVAVVARLDWNSAANIGDCVTYSFVILCTSEVI